MSKPTPGPWIVKHQSVFGGPDGRRLVAACAGHQSNVDWEAIDAENAANAHAVAQLPDIVVQRDALLEAAKAALRVLRDTYYLCGDSYEERDLVAAIALCQQEAAQQGGET